MEASQIAESEPESSLGESEYNSNWAHCSMPDLCHDLEISILSLEEVVDYTILSFPGITVQLLHMKYELCKSVGTYDCFMKNPTESHPFLLLPTIVTIKEMHIDDFYISVSPRIVQPLCIKILLKYRYVSLTEPVLNILTN